MTDGVSPWAEVLYAIIGLGLVVYAVTGGADLGAGLLSLFAHGPRKADQERAVRRAIAPIWEANHVWLIFVIVLLFSGFPQAFAALGVALHVPIALALVGIVFRGAAYVFHAYGIQTAEARAGWARVFGWASVLTPLALGAVVAGISSGDVRVSAAGVTTGFLAGWTTPFALAVGLFALALFALLAAVYLTAETSGALSDDFRRLAVVFELVAGACALATFLLAGRYAPALFENLRSSAWTWPIQGATAAAAAGTLGCLAARAVRLARLTAALQVTLVMFGWGLALRGHFILPDVSLATAASHPEVLPALVIAVVAGSLVLVPALAYLFWIFKREDDASYTGDHSDRS
ncbi:MAG TPA: cytochrome d ubiquinol oxidase subunit II [Polyangiaceae bacterium]|nr:cytochrome d ubiquinol oxidase subunit II [Polyangiaceae bacterium]